MTPTVVWVELLAAPLAMLGAFHGCKWLTQVSVVCICFLHVGIALTLRNAALLSFVACAPWTLFWPSSALSESFPATPKQTHSVKLGYILSILILSAMGAGNVWFGVFSEGCNQSVRHIWSTLLHNRWNVFVGAEEYVTWEIAPGQLVDGSIVDVWGRRDSVDWSLPGSGGMSVDYYENKVYATPLEIAHVSSSLSSVHSDCQTRSLAIIPISGRTGWRGW
jgi:hypothetical protein